MKKILFADNDPDFLDTRTEFIERAGFQVVKAYSLNEAERLLRDEWFSLAILDVRMRDDDDEKDVSGFMLAKQDFLRPVHKIILTNFPSYIHQALDGFSPIAEFLGKQDGPDVLITAIERAFAERTRINRDMLIDWKVRERFSLVIAVEPGLDDQRLLNRAEELEDLFRKVFHEYDHIRIDRLLWQSNGRVALVVFAFRESAKSESFLLVCGQNAVVRNEAAHFREYSPKAPGLSATVLSHEAETTHFAAIAYTLAGNDLERVQTLAELYHRGPDKEVKEKDFKAALTNLYQQTLAAWHQEKPIRELDKALEALYLDRLYLLAASTIERLETRQKAIIEQLPILGMKVEREEGRLAFRFGHQFFSYPDPLPLIFGRASQAPVIKITVPGKLAGESVLTDDAGRTWLTDFADAGYAPMLWNYVVLEAEVRYDWVETNDLQYRYELEKCLISDDFARFDSSDLAPVVRKPARAIQAIRSLAARTVGKDIHQYHMGTFFHAARRLADFDPAVPLTSHELARFGHILISMAMLAEIVFSDDEASVEPASQIAELRIADKNSLTVLVGNRQVRFPPQPFSLLCYLYEKADQICTAQELIEKPLQGQYNKKYLHTLIGRIRTKIEVDPKNPRYLITEPNVGYQLIPRPKI